MLATERKRKRVCFIQVTIYDLLTSLSLSLSLCHSIHSIIIYDSKLKEKKSFLISIFRNWFRIKSFKFHVTMEQKLNEILQQNMKIKPKRWGKKKFYTHQNDSMKYKECIPTFWLTCFNSVFFFFFRLFFRSTYNFTVRFFVASPFTDAIHLLEFKA